MDLSNYATKADLKESTHANTFSLTAKSDLVSLKSEVDNLNTDNLKTVPSYYLLKSFKNYLVSRHLKVFSDRLSEAMISSKFGTSKSCEYNSIARDIWYFLLKNDVCLSLWC